jgi:hypothetical protein
MNIMYISEPDVGQFYLPCNTCTNAGKKVKIQARKWINSMKRGQFIDLQRRSNDMI